MKITSKSRQLQKLTLKPDRQLTVKLLKKNQRFNWKIKINKVMANQRMQRLSSNRLMMNHLIMKLFGKRENIGKLLMKLFWKKIRMGHQLLVKLLKKILMMALLNFKKLLLNKLLKGLSLMMFKENRKLMEPLSQMNKQSKLQASNHPS